MQKDLLGVVAGKGLRLDWTGSVYTAHKNWEHSVKKSVFGQYLARANIVFCPLSEKPQYQPMLDSTFVINLPALGLIIPSPTS